MATSPSTQTIPILEPLTALAHKVAAPTQIAAGATATEQSDPDHLPDWSFLEQDLARASQKALGALERGRKYDNVLALAIYWHQLLTDRPHLAVEAERLLTVFKEQFSYEIDRHVLHGEDAYRNLTRRLMAVDDQLRSEVKENLLILYYAGHGVVSDVDLTTRLWQSSVTKTTPKTIDWHRMQKLLEDSKFDILFIFDCCHAMAMPDPMITWQQRCEVVGASGPREKAGGRPSNSFTAALVGLLEDDIREVKETNALRLGSTMKGREYKSKLGSTPDYKLLSEGYTTIPLVPLDKPDVTQDDASSAKTLVSTLTSSDARVLFSFATSDVPQARAFMRMLAVLPPNVVGIQIAVRPQKLLDALGLFRGNSAIGILSVPVWLWCTMSSNPAYKYIGVIRSGNLLENVPPEDEQQVEIQKYSSMGTQTDNRKHPPIPVPEPIPKISPSPGPMQHITAPVPVPEDIIYVQSDHLLGGTFSDRTSVPWTVPRTPPFASPEGQRLEQRISKTTASISSARIQSDIDKMSSGHLGLRTRGLGAGARHLAGVLLKF